MSPRYAVVDGVGNVENVIVWDSEADYTPPEGLTLVPVTDAGPGDVIDNKGKVKIRAENPPKAFTSDDRIAALEAKIAALEAKIVALEKRR